MMDKNNFRKIVRGAKIPAGHRILDAAIAHALLLRLRALQVAHSRRSRRPFCVLLYLPLPNEANISPLFALLRKQKKIHIFVPFMVGISLKIVKYRLPLFTKKFGIREPLESSFAPKTFHVAVVPMLGVDNQLKRIGYGKGKYDRFFATQPKKPRIFFVARELYYSRKNLCDSHDIQADEVLTYKINIKRGKNDRFDRMDAPMLRCLRPCRGIQQLVD